MTGDAAGPETDPADGGGAPDEGRQDLRSSVGPAVWITGGAMLLVGAVTAVLMLNDFRSRSYLYLAFYSIPSNAAVSVFPHEPVLLYFGKFANVWIAAGAATVGTLAAGWMDHTVFVPVLHLRSLQGYREHRVYRKAIELYRRWPFLTLVLAGLTPLPFFPFKFLSFSSAYPMGRYLAALALSRFPRYVVLLWAGALLEIPDWALVALFVAILAVYVWRAGPEVVRRLLGGGRDDG